MFSITWVCVSRHLTTFGRSPPTAWRCREGSRGRSRPRWVRLWKGAARQRRMRPPSAKGQASLTRRDAEWGLFPWAEAHGYRQITATRYGGSRTARRILSHPPLAPGPVAFLLLCPRRRFRLPFPAFYAMGCPIGKRRRHQCAGNTPVGGRGPVPGQFRPQRGPILPAGPRLDLPPVRRSAVREEAHRIGKGQCLIPPWVARG